MENLIITGNVGQDATIKNANGKEFASFTVAVNNSYKKEDGTKVETTNWYNVSTKQTTVAPFLKKGTIVYVSGKPKYSIYQDKNGDKKISLDLNAREIELMGAKKEENKD
jgi:single-strand DNA-binding protein